MFEKVSPRHIDKIADRIAGAMVDLAYANQEEPKVAIEVLIGHHECHIIAESSYSFSIDEVVPIVERITERGDFEITLTVVPQDKHLEENQSNGLSCGDNGIFRGVKTTWEEFNLSQLAKYIYNNIIASDGKYLIDNDTITICQSGIDSSTLNELLQGFLSNYDYLTIINPLGNWENDLNNDTGVTGRKLGSDLGRGATGGAIVGKDLSKADVSINIFLYLLLNKYNTLYALANKSLRNALNHLEEYSNVRNLDSIETTCNIGDRMVGILDVLVDFADIVDVVKQYITVCVGGFEKLATWGLV